MAHRKWLLVFIAFLFLAGCGTNRTPPEYMKDIAAYKEGTDGLVVYFVLADATGVPTSSDGNAKLKIVEVERNWSSLYSEYVESESTLFEYSKHVYTGDFFQTTVGLGAFERKVLLFSFGRIPYHMFTSPPSETDGKVYVSFETNDGKLFEAEDTIYF